MDLTKVNKPVADLYNLLTKYGYNMKLGEAHRVLERYQEEIDRHSAARTALMACLEVMGFDSNGNLRNPEIARRINNADEWIIRGIQLALNVHAGHHCSPFTPENLLEDQSKEHSNLKDSTSVESYRESLTAILNKR